MFLNLKQSIAETPDKAVVFIRDEVIQIFDDDNAAVETARSIVLKHGYKRSLVSVKRVPNNSFLKLLSFYLGDLYEDPNAGMLCSRIEEVRAALSDFRKIFVHDIR